MSYDQGRGQRQINKLDRAFDVLGLPGYFSIRSQMSYLANGLLAGIVTHTCVNLAFETDTHL